MPRETSATYRAASNAPTAAGQRTGLLLHCIVFVLLTLVALYVCRPLWEYFEAGVPFGTTNKVQGLKHLRPSDSTQLYAWFMTFKANVEQFADPILSAYEFGPLDTQKQLRLGYWGFPLQLPFMVFAWIFGGTIAYNLIVLLSFPVTAFCQYWLLRVFGVDRLLSILGGFMFAFCLSRRAQMFGGHANGLLYYHLPLIAAALALVVKKSSVRMSIVAGIAIFSIALGELHMFYYTALFLPPYFVFLLYIHRATAFRNMSRLLRCLLVLSVFSMASVAYTFWVQTTFISGSSAKGNRGIKKVKRWSPSAKHLVDRGRYTKADVWSGGAIEPSIYIGNIALGSCLLLLAVLVVLTIAGRGRETDNPATGPPAQGLTPLLFFGGAGLLTGGLALGVHSEGPQVYAFLFDHFPYWNSSRVPGRMIYLTNACLAFCLPYLAMVIGKRLPTRGILGVAAVLILAVVIDLIGASPRVLISETHPVTSKVYEKIRTIPQSELGPLLFFPVYKEDSLNAGFLGVSVELKRPYLNGYAPTAPVEALTFLKNMQGINAGKFTQAARCEAWGLGVRYIVYDTWINYLRRLRIKKNALAAMVKSGTLRLVLKDKDAQLYALVEPEGCPE